MRSLPRPCKNAHASSNASQIVRGYTSSMWLLCNSLPRLHHWTGPSPRRMDWSLRSLCARKRGGSCLPIARYCQDQATACARRARLASSPEIVAYCRNLEFRWLRLAEQAHGTGGALGHESGLTATSFPLHDKPAAYPAEYAKRAGELIARSARSLHRLRQKN